jgi:hypothetical protein
MGIHLSSERNGEAAAKPIRGISRLVNPPEERDDLISGQEDQDARDYLDHLLRMADRALSRGKKRGSRRS